VLPDPKRRKTSSRNTTIIINIDNLGILGFLHRGKRFEKEDRRERERENTFRYFVEEETMGG